MPQILAILKQGNHLPRIYRTDNARELKSNHAPQTYASLGIQYENNTTHQPQEDSIAERIKQTLMNADRAYTRQISPTRTGKMQYEMPHKNTTSFHTEPLDTPNTHYGTNKKRNPNKWSSSDR